MVNRNPKKGWTPSWSGRGTALLDVIETQYVKTYYPSHPTPRTVAIEEKLQMLLKKYPKRRFYKSLARQIKKYSLSKSQIHLIELDYGKYFKKY